MEPRPPFGHNDEQPDGSLTELERISSLGGMDVGELSGLQAAENNLLSGEFDEPSSSSEEETVQITDSTNQIGSNPEVAFVDDSMLTGRYRAAAKALRILHEAEFGNIEDALAQSDNELGNLDKLKKIIKEVAVERSMLALKTLGNDLDKFGPRDAFELLLNQLSAYEAAVDETTGGWAEAKEILNRMRRGWEQTRGSDLVNLFYDLRMKVDGSDSTFRHLLVRFIDDSHISAIAKSLIEGRISSKQAEILMSIPSLDKNALMDAVDMLLKTSRYSEATMFASQIIDSTQNQTLKSYVMLQIKERQEKSKTHPIDRDPNNKRVFEDDEDEDTHDTGIQPQAGSGRVMPVVPEHLLKRSKKRRREIEEGSASDEDDEDDSRWRRPHD